MEVQSTRLSYIDAARGVGICLVVYGHVVRGLMSAGLIPESALWLRLDYFLYTFHMPAFFFLAGINVDKSILRGKSKFLGGKFYTIAYPFLLWTSIQAWVMHLASGTTNSPPPMDLPGRMLVGEAYQFWFLYALGVCHVLAVIFLPRRAMMLGISIALVALSEAFTPETIMEKITYNFLFYTIGVLVGRNLGVLSPLFGHWWRVILVAASFLFCAAISLYTRPGSYSTVMAIPAAIAGIALLLQIGRLLERQQAAAQIGIASMTIFALHIIVGSGTRIVLHKAGVTNGILLLGVCTPIAILAPTIAHFAMKRFAILPYLGLEAPARRN